MLIFQLDETQVIFCSAELKKFPIIYAFSIAFGYALGSVPFGYLIVKLCGQGDIRDTGSGGTGATNVTRRAGNFAGIFTLALDALKGAAAIILVKLFFLSLQGCWTPESILAFHLVGVAAVAGHCFPVWLGFRGGKGVATALGVFLILSPFAVLYAALLFVPVVWLTRYVSLGSILAAVTIPLCIWVFPERTARTIDFEPLLISSILISALIVFMHRANIARLVRGTENKLK
ncbi:MAG: glycerol-3-phosphate 1-O-acyltransferase PlsY [Pyrinomonadaceae bacterium]